MKFPSKTLDRKERNGKREIVRFISVYILLTAAFLLLIGLEPVKKIVDINGSYTRLVVLLTAMLLKPFDVVEGINGSIIQLRGISLNVLFGCNGLEAFLIYAAAVLAFRASWGKRLFGIVIGFLVLQLLNVLRITALGIVGVYFRDFFYYFHVYVAQGIMIAFALVMFMAYMSYANKNKH